MPLTYKFPKKHNIVDETKIYLIAVKKGRSFLSIKVAFSISKEAHNYKEFVRLSQDWIEAREWLFNAEDVETYKTEENAEDIDYFSEEYLTPVPEKPGFSSWNPPKGAYGRLLDKNIAGLWKQQDTIFSFDEELGLFTFWEIVTSCAGTKGIIEDLRSIKRGEDLGHFVTESYILSLLKALHLLWD